MSKITNDQIKTCATIFGLCYTAMGKNNTADISNAQRFPLRGITLYIRELNQRHLTTPELEKKIGKLMDTLPMELMENHFEDCLTLEQQGVWLMAFHSTTNEYFSSL